MLEFFEKLFDTASVGGVLVCIIVVTLVLSYGLTIRWISKGQVDETESQ